MAMTLAATKFDLMTAIIIVVAYLAIFVWLMISISKNAGKIHAQLDKFMELAKATDNNAELRRLHTALTKYASAECWHKAFGSHVMEVSGFIRGKIAKTN
jgi:site-specific recombinase